MKIFRYALGLMLLATAGLCAEGLKEWTFIIYMVPDRGLDEWVLKNRAAMVQAQSNDDVALFIQLYRTGDQAERYWVRNNQLVEDAHADVSHIMSDDIASAVSYAAQHAPAKRYGVICWGHGWGSLNPTYDAATETWGCEADHVMECTNGVCPIKSFVETNHDSHRGALVHAATNTMLTTTAIETCVLSIAQTLGQPLEFIGFDCCKMAMLDIANHLKSSVRYLVGSQNCELADGWNYADFLTVVAQDPRASTEAVVKAITDTYKQYYQAHTEKNTYTLSAIQLDAVEALNNSIELLVRELCVVNDREALLEVLTRARRAGLNMCSTPAFTDLGVLLDLMGREIQDNVDFTDDEQTVLLAVLCDVNSKLNDAIFANETGDAVSAMRGMSVYFPFTHIDSSYASNYRAQQSPWMRLLTLYGLES